MQKFNYHTHTYRCGHADKKMMDEEYVLEFINKGFKTIAFSDHNPQREIVDKRNNMRMKYSEIDEYLESINYLKEKYEDKIKIESGFEVEYLPGMEDYLFELKNRTDKILLGQHFIYDDNNKDLKIFRWHDFNDYDLIKYAKYIEEAMKLGIPSIVVHPDLYMLGRNKFGDIERRVAEIICEASEKYNIPLEINLTEGCLSLFNEDYHISYPCKDFWKVASKYKIRVLYGIDAHFKEQIRCYENSIQIVNELIGEDIINKLNFVDEL